MRDQAQRLFNTIRTHLLTQNKKARTVAGRCKYRTDSGLKCAVGCLITDSVYEDVGRIIEGRPAEAPEVTQAVEESIGETLDVRAESMLYRMQRLHDNYDPPDWEAQMEQVAADLKLEIRR